jgi:hypothetical protein
MAIIVYSTIKRWFHGQSSVNAQKATVKRVMHEFKHRELNTGTGRK